MLSISSYYRYWLYPHTIQYSLESILYPIVCASHSSSLYCLSPSSQEEKAMALYPCTLAWKIPWMEEPGALQSMGSLGVRHDWATSLSLFTFMHWRRRWQPTPVFLPGESQGRGSLVGCRLWGHRVGHNWSDLAAAAAAAGIRNSMWDVSDAKPQIGFR